jgi:hypothetical protein
VDITVRHVCPIFQAFRHGETYFPIGSRRPEKRAGQVSSIFRHAVFPQIADVDDLQNVLLMAGGTSTTEIARGLGIHA